MKRLMLLEMTNTALIPPMHQSTHLVEAMSLAEATSLLEYAMFLKRWILKRRHEPKHRSSTAMAFTLAPRIWKKTKEHALHAALVTHDFEIK